MSEMNLDRPLNAGPWTPPKARHDAWPERTARRARLASACDAPDDGSAYNSPEASPGAVRELSADGREVGTHIRGPWDATTEARPAKRWNIPVIVAWIATLLVSLGCWAGLIALCKAFF